MNDFFRQSNLKSEFCPIVTISIIPRIGVTSSLVHASYVRCKHMARVMNRHPNILHSFMSSSSHSNAFKEPGKGSSH